MTTLLHSPKSGQMVTLRATKALNNRDITTDLGLPPNATRVLFGDDSWGFKAHPRTAITMSHSLINFAPIDERFRDMAKLMTLTHMNVDAAYRITGIPADTLKGILGSKSRAGNDQKPGSPTTAGNHNAKLRSALDRLAGDNHPTHITDWEAVTQSLRKNMHRRKGVSEIAKPATVRGRVEAIMLLDRFARAVAPKSSRIASHGLFGTVPWDAVSMSVVVPFTSEEADELNQVPPNWDVMAVFQVAEWIVRHLADDIIKLATHYKRIPATQPSVIARGHRFTATTKDPGWQPDWWGDEEPMDTRTVGLWIQRLSAAAFWCVAVGLAMRQQDIARLDHNALVTDGKGGVTVRAWRTKNRGAPVETSFAPPNHVITAIDVQRRLLLSRGFTVADLPTIDDIPISGRTRLFPNSIHKTPRGALTWSHGNEAHHGAARLVSASDHLRSIHTGVAADFDLDIGGMTPSMQESRVTALCHYASRGQFGIALAAHYSKHSTAAVFGGYVGGVQQRMHILNTRLVAIDHERDKDELERIREHLRAAHLAQVTEMQVAADAADDPRLGLSGHGLAKLSRKLADGDNGDVLVEADENGALRLKNPKPLTPVEVRRISENNTNVYGGPLTLCLFNREGALCESKGQADFRLCKPLQCANSVMSPGQRAVKEIRRRISDRLGYQQLIALDVEPMDEHLPTSEDDWEDKTDDELFDLYMAECDDFARRVMTQMGAASPTPGGTS